MHVCVHAMTASAGAAEPGVVRWTCGGRGRRATLSVLSGDVFGGVCGGGDGNDDDSGNVLLLFTANETAAQLLVQRTGCTCHLLVVTGSSC